MIGENAVPQVTAAPSKDGRHDVPYNAGGSKGVSLQLAVQVIPG